MYATGQTQGRGLVLLQQCVINCGGSGELSSAVSSIKLRADPDHGMVMAPGGCVSLSLKINLTLSYVTGLNFRSWYLTDMADFALMFQVNQCDSGGKSSSVSVFF